MVFLYYRRETVDLNKFSEDTFWYVKYGPEDLAVLKKCNGICMLVYYIKIPVALLTPWTSELTRAMGILMCITLQSSTEVQLLNSCILPANMGLNETERRLSMEPPSFLNQKTSPLFEIYFTTELSF